MGLGAVITKVFLAVLTKGGDYVLIVAALTDGLILGKPEMSGWVQLLFKRSFIFTLLFTQKVFFSFQVRINIVFP